MKELFTVKDFCEAHGIGKTTFYAEMATGRLRVVKIGTASRVTRADAQAWVASLPAQIEAA